MSDEITEQQRDAVLARVRSEVQAQALQDLVQKMTAKCFEKCIIKPGSRLESKEQACLAMCMDRYMDTMKVVSHAAMSKGQRG